MIEPKYKPGDLLTNKPGKIDDSSDLFLIIGIVNDHMYYQSRCYEYIWLRNKRTHIIECDRVDEFHKVRKLNND